MTVYSDGSRDEGGNAGASYCVYRRFQEIISQSIPLGRTVDDFGAEVIGALEALRAASSHMMSRYTANMVIFLDKYEATVRLYDCTHVVSEIVTLVKYILGKSITE